MFFGKGEDKFMDWNPSSYNQIIPPENGRGGIFLGDISGAQNSEFLKT